MEYWTLERELHIRASPEVVFDVISRPEHIREWWDVEVQPAVGASVEATWRDEAPGRAMGVVPIRVVAARPPRLFSFRWTQTPGEVPGQSNSLLVTFDLSPSGNGTVLRLTETGFRERDWNVAVREKTYREHAKGWDFFLPRIAERAARETAAR